MQVYVYEIISVSIGVCCNTCLASVAIHVELQLHKKGKTNLPSLKRMRTRHASPDHNFF